MINYFTAPQSLLHGAFSVVDGSPLSRRTALLAADHYVQGGKEIDVTPEILATMAKNFTSGVLGAKRAVTLAHPDDMSAAPAVGWIDCASAMILDIAGKPTITAIVEWCADMAKAIDDKAWGYISPVFTGAYTDQNGQEQGPAILFAGVTNDPHWTSQPGLLAQFCAHGARGEESMSDLAKGNAAPNAANGDELVKLTARLDDVQAKFAAATTELAEARKRADSAEARIVAIESERRVEQGKHLIARFTAEGRIQEKHLVKDGKPTALATMATDDPVKFEAIVGLMDPAPVAKNQAAVGEEGEDGDAEKTIEEKAVKLATAFCAEHKGLRYIDVSVAAMQAARAGKALTLINGKVAVQ